MQLDDLTFAPRNLAPHASSVLNSVLILSYKFVLRFESSKRYYYHVCAKSNNLKIYSLLPRTEMRKRLVVTSSPPS